MRKFWKILKIVVLVLLACMVFGYVTMRLWNWLVPGIFGWHSITFAQAIGLFVLSKLLFGGFHKHGGGLGRERGREWKRQMEERFAQMSPEERERFRSGMRGCDWRRRGERSDEKRTV